MARMNLAHGGAINNDSGVLRVSGCSIIGNQAKGLGRGYVDTGPALNGSSAAGGGMYISGGEVYLVRTLLGSNCVEGGDGGSGEMGHLAGSGGDALGAAICLSGGSLTITNCAVVGNYAIAGSAPVASRYIGYPGTGYGGGLYAQAGSLIACNSTLSDNSAFAGVTGGGGFGGGPSTGGYSFGGALAIANATGILANCTITQNGAFGGTNVTRPGSGFGGGIAITYYGTGTVSLVNTILAGNLVGGTNFLLSDVYGIPQSLGHNLVGITSNAASFVSSDIIGQDPKLGPLQYNGGATPTHALLVGSPAIDAGAPASTPFDQRDQPRTIDDPGVVNRNGSDGTDIGAVEANPFLALQSITMASDSVLVSFPTMSSKSYGLLYKSGLEYTQWLNVAGLQPGTGGIITATNTGPATTNTGFYRVYAR